MQSAAGAAPISVGLGARWARLSRRPVIMLAIVLAVGVLVVPEKTLATQILVFGLFATSFNILLGYAGLLSFGHSTFLGLGAYGAALTLKWWHPHVLVAIAAGVALATVSALVIGWFCLRRRQVYFSMLTLAFNQMVFFLFFQARDVTGGDDGLRGIPIPDFDIPFVGSIPIEGTHYPYNFYFFVLILVIASLLFIERIVDSPFGRVLQAIRESEERAKAVGYDTNRVLLLAVLFSGAFGGLAGALYALFFGFVGLETLGWLTAGVGVIMAILGGVGSFVGPFIGAGIYLVLQEYVSKYRDDWQLYVGAIFVACVLFFPRGVWGTLKMLVIRPTAPAPAETGEVTSPARAMPAVGGE
ncbi:MAG: branched-chain amino acid ABC transporter permease [Chloroflexi bacterium]|nr:branched-chain amino acid ABC transporter permease [Chloroflexota bacterium]